ncbi:MAG: hypothetical protein ACK5SP_00685 [bacterium]
MSMSHFIMAWGDWMSPQMGLEHHLELERGRRALANSTPDQVMAHALRLWQLTIHQSLIIRGATRRIAELECREALQDQ